MTLDEQRLKKLDPRVRIPPRHRQLPGPENGVLSSKFGGKRMDLKRNYCLFYKYRPIILTDMVLCSGGGMFDKVCPDIDRCAENIDQIIAHVQHLINREQNDEL